MGSVGIGNWNAFAQGVGRDIGTNEAGGRKTLDNQVKATKAFVPSTGVTRFLWCIFTFGFNELVRSAKIREQKTAMRDMSAGIGRMHYALSVLAKSEMECAYHQRAVQVVTGYGTPRTHTLAYVADKCKNQNVTVKYGLLDKDTVLNKSSGCRLIAPDDKDYLVEQQYLEDWGRHHCIEFTMGSGEGACSVRLHTDDRGEVHMVVPDGAKDQNGNTVDFVQDLGLPHVALKTLELATAGNSEVFSPDMFERMLNNYDENLREFRATNNGDREIQGAYRGDFRRQQLDLCRKILESRCNLPKEKRDYLDRGMAKDLALAAVRGDLDKPGSCESFYDRITSVRHLNTQDGMRIYDQLDGEESVGRSLPVRYREKERGLRAVKTPENAKNLPTAEQQGVHDFAADLIYDGDATAYDRDIDTNGRLNGGRLCAVFDKHKATVAKLIEERLADRTQTPPSLASLDEGMRAGIAKIIDQLISMTEKARFAGGPLTKNDVVARLENCISSYRSGKSHLTNPNQLGDLPQVAIFSSAGIGVSSAGKGVGDDRSYGVADLKTKKLKVEKGIVECGDRDLKGLEKAGLDGLIKEAEGVDEKNSVRLESAENFFAQVEASLDQELDGPMGDLQGKISKMVDDVFPAPAGNEDPFADGNWTNDSILGDPKRNPEMQLLRLVLHDYFKSMPRVDQRSMLASMTRNSVTGASDEFRFGQILKGAGPILQKMLQGLDPDTFKDKPDFAAAIADMRDNLAPLPRRVINAHLLDIVKTYNEDSAHAQNPIGNIEVTRPCGAASVAQTLLCTVNFQNGESRDCVIKVLRPEAKLRAMREEKLFTRHAGGIKGMKETFASRLEGIMEEFDFRVESANVGKGVQVYEDQYGNSREFEGVRSMHLFPGIVPTPGAMVLEKAPGTTLSGYTKQVGKSAKAVAETGIGEIRNGAFDDVDIRLLESCESLTGLYEDVITKHRSLNNLTYMWIKEGLFASKKGFYHGDLHAGNIMVPECGPGKERGNQPVDSKTITMIDFGNARELTSDEQSYVIRVIAGAASGENGVDLFAGGFAKMLSKGSLEKFIDPNTGKVKAKIRADLEKAFQEGTCRDAAKRMKAALLILQSKYEVAIPGPINDFLMSQDRLSVAMESTLHTMTQVEMHRLAVIGEAARRIGYDGGEAGTDLASCEKAFAKDQSEDNARKLFAARSAFAAAFVADRIRSLPPGSKEREDYVKLQDALQKSANDRPTSIMQCMVNVIKQNILTALNRVGSVGESVRLERKFREEGLIGGGGPDQQAEKEYRFVRIEG